MRRRRPYEAFLPLGVGQAAHGGRRDVDRHPRAVAEDRGREVDGEDVPEDAGSETDQREGVAVPAEGCGGC